MTQQFARTQLLLGSEAMERLARARVAVFGVGGVGGHAVEALARSGVGALDLVDNDLVCLSNINRQVVATLETVGQPKVDAFAARIAAINPDCTVTCHHCFYLPETADRFDFSAYDYVLDCVDTVTAKLDLVQRAQAAGTPVISAMGAANKLDPTRIRVGDIFETSICPLARIMRKECRKRRIKGFKAVYSTEPAMRPREDVPVEEDEAYENPYAAPGERNKRSGTPGSVSWVPSVAGLIMAGEVIRDLVRLS